MLQFSPQFLMLTPFIIDNESNYALLMSIYNGQSSFVFNEIPNFENCKAQLLALVEHIIELDPIKFSFLHSFRQNICLLSPADSMIKQYIYLNYFKKKLEQNIVNITERHDKIKSQFTFFPHKTDYDLLYIILFFQELNVTQFTLSVKQNLVIRLIEEVLNESTFTSLSEINLVGIDKLMQKASIMFGLAVPSSPVHEQPTGISDHFIEKILIATQHKFTPKKLIDELAHILILPQVVLRRTDSNYQSYINRIYYVSLLLSRNAKPLHESHYQKKIVEQLYIKNNNCLRPSVHFDLFVKCWVTNFLIQQQYIGQEYFLGLFFNGQQFMKYDASHGFSLLSDDDILQALDQITLTDRSIYEENLRSQLSTITLFNLARNVDSSQKNKYFELLMMRSDLSNEQIMFLYHVLFPTKKARIVDYIFKHGIEVDQLNLYLETTDTTTNYNYLKQAITNNQLNHTKYLLAELETHLLDSQRQSLMLVAIQHAKPQLLLLMKCKGFDFNVIIDRITSECIDKWCDNKQALIVLKDLGVSFHPVIRKAILSSNLKALELFYDIGVSLDEFFLNNESPALGAAFAGKVEVLELLYRLGIDLEKSNSAGYNVSFLAAFNGHLGVLRFLHTKGLLNLSAVNMPYADFMQIFPGYKSTQHRDFIALTPIEIADKMGHLDVGNFLKALPKPNYFHIHRLFEQYLPPSPEPYKSSVPNLNS